MKKSVWIFLLAVFLPGAVLGWLALRGVEEQQIIFERRTAELYQKETEALAASVREAVEAERRAFGDAVHRLLARSDADALARDFTNTLADVWPRKAIGFALNPDGDLVSPNVKSAANDTELRNFLWDNGEWLCSAQPAVVYRVPIDNKLTAMGNQMDRSKSYGNLAPDNNRYFATRANNNNDDAGNLNGAPVSSSVQRRRVMDQQVPASEKNLMEGQTQDFSRAETNAPAGPASSTPLTTTGTVESKQKAVSRSGEAETGRSTTPASTPPPTLFEAAPADPIPPAMPAPALAPGAAPVTTEAKPITETIADHAVAGKKLASADAAKDAASKAELPKALSEKLHKQVPPDDAMAAQVPQEIAPANQPLVRGEVLALKPAGLPASPAKPATFPLPTPDAAPMPAMATPAPASPITPLPPLNRTSAVGGAQVVAPAPAPPMAAAAPVEFQQQIPAEPAAETMDALITKEQFAKLTRTEDRMKGELEAAAALRSPAPKASVLNPSSRVGDTTANASGGMGGTRSAQPALSDAFKEAAGKNAESPAQQASAAAPAPETAAAPAKQKPLEGTKMEPRLLSFSGGAPEERALPRPASKAVTNDSDVVLKKDLPWGGLTLGLEAQRRKENAERGRQVPDANRQREQRAFPVDNESAHFNAANGKLYSFVPSDSPAQAFSAPATPPVAQKRDDYTQLATTQNRGVEPIQMLNAPSQAVSSLVPSAAEFRVLTAMSDEGMVSRFVQDKLDLIFWIRPPEAPEMIFGCLVEAGNLKELWPNLLGHTTDGSSTNDRSGNPPFILALLDDKAKPVATLPAGQEQREWKRPFVASEIGEALPHWEAALYLMKPGALAESARGLRRTLSFTVVSALALIILGAWLVVADIRRQLALAQQKTDFVSNVSHELKTPLTSIRMFAELMHDRPPPADKQGQYLRIITVEAERLTRLINNVLDFAKLERRQKRFDKRPLDLHQVIGRVWEGQEMHLRDAGFATRWQAAPPPYPVQGDEDALSQVLVNLLSNAEKYSLETKDVELHTWIEDRWLCISVLDRGMGVPAGEERKIFESFYRAHDSLSSGIQGSGLGLTLAQRLAEEHGGKIEFSRRDGGGSRFTLRLPLVPDDHHRPTGLCGPADAFPSDSRPPTV